MEKNRDVGKILLKINSQYYEKGMKNISIQLKGVRKGKIAEMDRKVIIPQIIRSKEYNIFEKQFLKNIDDEIKNIAKQDKVQEIVNNPKANFYTYEDFDKELLYLYLFSLNDEKYDDILQELLELVCNEQEVERDTKEKEIQRLKDKCEDYEKEIEQLKTISRQRKEKIKELEIKSNILTEEFDKLKLENEDLKRQVEEKEKRIEEYESKIKPVVEEEIEKEKEIEKNKVVVIGKETSLTAIQEENIDKILLEEFSEELLHVYDKFLIVKKNISIGNLRKIKKMLGDRGILCENDEEVNKYIISMEAKYENRSN